MSIEILHKRRQRSHARQGVLVGWLQFVITINGQHTRTAPPPPPLPPPPPPTRKNTKRRSMCKQMWPVTRAWQAPCLVRLNTPSVVHKPDPPPPPPPPKKKIGRISTHVRERARLPERRPDFDNAFTDSANTLDAHRAHHVVNGHTERTQSSRAKLQLDKEVEWIVPDKTC